LVEQVEHPHLGEFDHRQQQIEVEVTPDHRGCAEGGAGVRSQALHPPADHLAHAFGQTKFGDVADQAPAPALLLHQRPGLRQMAQQLSGEERVARRLARDLLRQRAPDLVHLVAGGRLHQREHLLGVQARELDPLAALVAVKVRQQRAQRVTVREIGVTVGSNDHDPHRRA
jgi:hypothetical protein